MSRFKGLSTIYLQKSGSTSNWNNFGNDVEVLNTSFTDNATLYGIRFVITNGSFASNGVLMKIERTSAIEGAASEKIYPFDDYEDFTFATVQGTNGTQNISDITFIHPIKVARGHSIIIKLKTIPNDAVGTPEIEALLNYVEDQAF